MELRHANLQEPWIDTTTPIGKAMFRVTIAWAGLEKQMLSERTRAPPSRPIQRAVGAVPGPA